MIKTPFPRPPFRVYISAALITGFSIAFILNVFQPFGTQNFNHPNKFWILSGYGIVVSLSVIIFYLTSLFLINRSNENSWTIIRESIDLFLSLLMSIGLSYIYYLSVFDLPFDSKDMFHFMINAGMVSLLPMVGHFLYFYVKFRDVQRAQVNFESDPKTSAEKRIEIKGDNKNEVVNVPESDILFIKAEDNYIILFVLIEGSVKMRMIRKTLKAITEELSKQNFMRCHKSYVINVNRIQSLKGNKNRSKVIIEGASKEIPVSRTKFDELKSLCKPI